MKNNENKSTGHYKHLKRFFEKKKKNSQCLVEKIKKKKKKKKNKVEHTQKMPDRKKIWKT